MSSASTAPQKYQLFIDGQWVDSESGKTFKTPNPATGETLAEVAEADKADIDKAVAAARRAFEGKWSKLSARDRGRLLYKLSQLIEQHTRGTCRVGDCRQRQADQRIALRRLAASGRELRVLRRLVDQDRRRNDSRARQDVQLHLARADWCLWSDHSVELSLVDGSMEARSRAGSREYSRSQTRGADSCRRDGAREIDPGSRVPGRRREYRSRLW